MANNIVSRWLHDVPKQDALDATNYEKAARIRDYAAKLDRLVEAATTIRDFPHIIDCECKGCVEIFNALDAALTDIQLQSRRRGRKTNGT